MTINLSAIQIVIIIFYALLFSFVVAMVRANTNDHPHKHPEEILPYFAAFFFIEILFVIGLYITLTATAHFTAAAVVLVTLRYSDQKGVYDPAKTEKLIAEDAEKVSWYFKHRIQTPFFYEYHLIDDKNSMQIFQCPESDLLQRVKDTVVKDDKGELRIASEHPLNK